MPSTSVVNAGTRAQSSLAMKLDPAEARSAAPKEVTSCPQAVGLGHALPGPIPHSSGYWMCEESPDADSSIIKRDLFKTPSGVSERTELSLGASGALGEDQDP